MVGDDPVSKVAVSRAQGIAGSNRVVITHAQGIASSAARVIVSRAQGSSIADTVITIGSPATWEPFDVVVMTATRSGGVFAEPTGCVWFQTAGPTVTLEPVGAVCTFTAPATEDGTTVSFQCIADGGAQATVTHTVKAHAGFFIRVGNALQGVGVTT